ncbi:MAG: cupin domain-containing protein [Nitrospirae bacterium]|nr:cupin domain-containing protein [Candidatus Manganitrophaceae bacterium]
MRKVNLKDIPDESWSSPKGKFGGASKEISVALGRKPNSMDLKERHPFDVELCRIPPGKIHSPYHSHSAQWEFYHVISGTGQVRHQEGTTPIEAGDAFLFEPDQPHQLINHSSEDLVLYVVADNPIGESAYYPDSKKWLVRSPERRVIRPANSKEMDYHEDEE